MDNTNFDDIEEKNKESLREYRRRRDQEIDDLQKILKLPEGRRLLWRIWSICGVFSNPFNPNANQTGFNSGMMKVGQILLSDVNEADTFAFAKIQQEYVSAVKSKKQLKQEDL